MNQILQQYSVPTLIAFGVLLVIQLLKSEKIPITIPARLQPLAAVGLALVAAIATGVAQGKPIGQALVDGLMGGIGSTGLFEFGSKLMPASNGSSGPPASPPTILGAALVLAIALSACTAEQGKVATKTALDVSDAVCKELDADLQDEPSWVKFTCEALSTADQVSHTFLVKARRADPGAVFSMKKCAAPSEGGVSP